jgi:hypothetical protein
LGCTIAVIVSISAGSWAVEIFLLQWLPCNKFCVHGGKRHLRYNRTGMQMEAAIYWIHAELSGWESLAPPLQYNLNMLTTLPSPLCTTFSTTLLSIFICMVVAALLLTTLKYSNLVTGASRERSCTSWSYRSWIVSSS